VLPTRTKPIPASASRIARFNAGDGSRFSIGNVLFTVASVNARLWKSIALLKIHHHPP